MLFNQANDLLCGIYSGGRRTQNTFLKKKMQIFSSYMVRYKKSFVPERMKIANQEFPLWFSG